MAAAGGDWGIVGGRAAQPRHGRRAGRPGRPVQRDHALRRRRRAPGSSGRWSARSAPAAATPVDVLALLADPRDPGGHADRDREGVPARRGRAAAATTPSCGPTSTTDRPPRTVPGLLARALRLRAAAGGAAARRGQLRQPAGQRRDACATVLRAGARRRRSGGWVSFPDTMVDRIVPASTPATLGRAEAALGVADLAAVEAEPFRQWVIEDDFPGGRPAWERGRRGAHRRRRRLRAAEAADAQRCPLDRGLPRRAGRVRDDRRRDARCPGMAELPARP